MKKVINLVGNKYGKWTVLSHLGEEANKHGHKWLCQCECGVKALVHGCNLRNGRTSSCKNCRVKGNRKDISKEIFGQLTAIHYVESRSGRTYWLL